jgi:hypothetical protein
MLRARSSVVNLGDGPTETHPLGIPTPEDKVPPLADL